MTVVPSTDGNAAPPLHTAATSSLVHYAVLALWIYFIFAASTGAWQLTGRNAERAAWLIMDLATLCLLLRHQSQFINIALTNPIFVSWALLACASSAWSTDPAFSLEHGLQLVLTTLVAFLLCIQLRLEQFVIVVFWAILLAALLALAVILIYPDRGIAYDGSWKGGFTHKNILGLTMVLLVISAVCLFLQGRWRLLTAASAALGLFLILMSRSASAILSLVLTLSPLPLAYAYLRGRSGFMTLLGIALVLGAFATIGAYISIEFLRADPIDFVLSLVGKERTLTGRTEVWDLALRAIEERPWLGYGFKGYWADIPLEMRQLMAIVGGIPYFHNNYLEVAVAFGVIGPVLLSLGIIVAIIRCIRRVYFGDQPIDIWPLLIVVNIVILTFVENPLVWNHSLGHVLFVAAAVIRK